LLNLKPQEARELVGRPIHDSRGERLGEVRGVYFNDVGRDLEWVSFASDETLRFAPAADASDEQDRLTLPFTGDIFDNQPHIEPHDGALSAVQVARLHEFFQTFDGHTRITPASEGEPPTAAFGQGSAPVPLSGRQHEPAFGTGVPAPGEPHDVTLQGNGNSAP
jgi:sporulation protein YlmC with PRC-barrel domain